MSPFPKVVLVVILAIFFCIVIFYIPLFLCCSFVLAARYMEFYEVIVGLFGVIGFTSGLFAPISVCFTLIDFAENGSDGIIYQMYDDFKDAKKEYEKQTKIKLETKLEELEEYKESKSKSVSAWLNN